MSLYSRFTALFRRRKLEADMAEEMRAHLDLQAEEHVKRGLSPAAAHQVAQREFGGVEQIKEQARDERKRGWLWLEHFAQDVRYALRALRKTPSCTLAAIATLALGIGVNAALFTVYNVVALRPLPVKDPDGLVKIAGRGQRSGYYPNYSYAEYVAYRDGNQVLSDLVAVYEGMLRLDGPAGAEYDATFGVREPGVVPVQFVSDNYFQVLGGGMALGRGFAPEENRAPGLAPVIVLSHLFWERQLQSDPQVLGRTLTLGSTAYTVIGVAARDFAGQQPAPPAGWMPLMMWGRPADYGERGTQSLRLIGRLRPGVTEERAKADLDLLATRIGYRLPNGDVKAAVRLERGLRFIHVPMNARTLAALAPVVLGFGMVLVIACTNVANLLLARGVARQQEIGVRLTLGASRGRIVRQLLTENLLLCVLGSVLGLALAVWTLQALQPLILGRLPSEWAPETRRWSFLEISPDWRVFCCLIGLALFTTLAAGLLPALHASGAGVISALKNEGTLFGRRMSQSRLRSLLVILQVGVCLVLLSCAGLLARNAFELHRMDLGFDPPAIYSVAVAPKVPSPDRYVAFRQAVETLRTVPGVESVALAYPAPLRGSSSTQVKPVGSGNAAAREHRYSYVSPSFFATFGVRLSRGRVFTEGGEATGSRAVVVSEETARRFWPGEDAVGKTLAVSDAAFSTGKRSPIPGVFVDCEVVGVARDIVSRVGDTDRALLYLPLPRELGSAPVFIRPRIASPAAMAEIARAADAAGLALVGLRPMTTFFEEEMLPFFGLALLSGALGVLALLMAAVGIYGVMTFAVSQRVREIGIRVALGATLEQVTSLFVRQGMKLVAIGLALGVAGGALFALALAKVLFGLGRVFDPLAFGAMVVVFGAIAMLACWLPARRAAKVDPMVALRAE